MRRFLMASAAAVVVLTAGPGAYAVQQHHTGSTTEGAVEGQSSSGQAVPSQGLTAQGAASGAAAPTMVVVPGIQAPGGGCMMPMMGQVGMGMMGATMPMMSQGMPMMTAGVQPPMSAMGVQGMGIGGGVDRIEGRIAFLRAEIGITDTQGPAWDAFAQAVRSAAIHVGAPNMPMNSAGGPVTLAQGLEAQDVALGARLDDVKALRSTLAQLYEILSDDQRRAAEDLIPMVIGAIVAG